MIDWERLAEEVGAIREGGGERGGTDLARRALESILGPDALRAAVDYYVARGPGSELARSVLWFLQPPSAMDRCREIYRSSDCIEDRRAAIELLRVAGDSRVLTWVPEFLEDPDEGIQTWGAGIVDQLLWGGGVDPDECATILESMERHPNERVRDTVARIREYLRRRESETGTSTNQE